MELEELKNTWLSLEERLSKQEKLNANIIREMLVSKSNKSLSRLINYSIFGIIACLIIIPILIGTMPLVHQISIQIFMVNAFAFCVMGVILGIVDLIKLYQIEYSKPIGWNIQLIQKYKIYGNRVYIASCIMVALFLLSGIILSVIYVKMTLWLWLNIISTIVFTIIAIWWEYKQMFRKNVDSIIECLEELKELEEE